jgi:hypothetical protein
MPASLPGYRRPRVVLGLLVLIGLVGGALTLVPEDEARGLAERFARALDGEADGRLADYLAPDAQVFLQGAQTALSPPQFRDYMSQLTRSHRALHAASPVYLSEGGAGWLLEIKDLSDAAKFAPPGIDRSAQLWMQVSLGDDRITRVWVHFTVDALDRLHIAPDAYRATSERLHIPVPEAWQDGTAAMQQAAARHDQRTAVTWRTSARQTGQAAAWGALLVVPGAAGVLRLRQGRRPARAPHGQLLARLGRLHATHLPLSPGGAGETPRFTQRSWGAARAADLKYQRAGGSRIDSPAGVNDHRPDPGASPQAVRDELVVQA